MNVNDEEFESFEDSMGMHLLCIGTQGGCFSILI